MLGVAERDLASDESGFLGGLPVDLSDPADVAQDEVFPFGEPFELEVPLAICAARPDDDALFIKVGQRHAAFFGRTRDFQARERGRRHQADTEVAGDNFLALVVDQRDIARERRGSRLSVGRIGLGNSLGSQGVSLESEGVSTLPAARHQGEYEQAESHEETPGGRSGP